MTNKVKRLVCGLVFLLMLSELAYCEDIVSFTSGKYASKLKGILFGKDVKLVDIPAHELEYPKLRGAWLNKAVSPVWAKTFANDGGRLVMFCTGGDAKDLNDSFQELFGLTVVYEYVCKSRTNRSLAGDNFCPLWKGLRVTNEYPDSPSVISCYFMVKEKSWTCTSITSESTGKTRVVSAHKKLGKGEVLFIAKLTRKDYLQAPEVSIDRMYSNSALELLDNEEAVLAMVDWLVGRRRFPRNID